jgi:hypothetical protein
MRLWVSMIILVYKVMGSNVILKCEGCLHSSKIEEATLPIQILWDCPFEIIHITEICNGWGGSKLDTWRNSGLSVLIWAGISLRVRVSNILVGGYTWWWCSNRQLYSQSTHEKCISKSLKQRDQSDQREYGTNGTDQAMQDITINSLLIWTGQRP